MFASDALSRLHTVADKAVYNGLSLTLLQHLNIAHMYYNHKHLAHNLYKHKAKQKTQVITDPKEDDLQKLKPLSAIHCRLFSQKQNKI